MGSSSFNACPSRGASSASGCVESLVRPSGRHSGRLHTSIAQVCRVLRVTSYVVTHFKRPTCVIVQKRFSSRRRAYIYISEMLSLGVIRQGDFVDISTETKVDLNV